MRVVLAAEIGKRIRTNREALGLSQLALGAKIGVPANSLSAIESGTFTPSLSRLEQIANGLGVPLSSLVPGHDAPADIRRLLRHPDEPVLYGGRELTDAEKERLVVVLDATLSYSPPFSASSATIRQEEPEPERTEDEWRQEFYRESERRGFLQGAAQVEPGQRVRWSRETVEQMLSLMEQVRQDLLREREGQVEADGKSPNGRSGHR